MPTPTPQHDPRAFDGRQTAGRKGVAYDWQSVVAEHAARDLDGQLAAILSTGLPTA